MPKAKHSPCISVCEYDEQGYCLGCQRTEEEVRGWRDRTEQQQLDWYRDAERETNRERIIDALTRYMDT